ncbi:MAG: cytochrome c/FTR1 family iron permease, partial [Gammaproteobacteria bacterium]|nr:cytochrome c/FTR1 family iron permease [Gammaproteobacteria bacterium]
MKRFLLLPLLFSLAVIQSVQADTQQLLQLIDYVGVDYAEAIENGEVINQAEYSEMLDFSQGIQQLSIELPEGEVKQKITTDSVILAGMVKDKASPQSVSKLTADMRLAIIKGLNIIAIPRKQPDIQRAKNLYAENCASCHGADGYGDGIGGMNMEPAPTNFHDYGRYSQRTLYGLYSTITQGVADTGMRSFNEFSDEDRWSLAFYVGQLAVKPDLVTAGQTLGDEGIHSELLDLSVFTVTTPGEAEMNYGNEGSAVMSYLRTNPDSLFKKQSHLAFSQFKLDDTLEAYRKGDYRQSYQYAVEAYLEGFELIEQGLNAVDSDLRLEIENAMTGIRGEIRARKSYEEIEHQVRSIQNLLSLAKQRLDDRGLSGSAAFASSFFILLREGLEAILLVAALAAFLVKTERRDGLRYLHIGWVGALAAGFLTWWVSVSLIEISGASREITEGVAALLATGVLFYVGYWLQDKTHVAQWKKFIEHNVNRVLTSGALWGLAGLSFIAVYREVFETILFYQALWVQTDTHGQNMAFAGFGSAAAVLVVVAWLIMKYSIRLPLRQFFSVAGALMLVLAVIFAGKGVAALQEAGYIPISVVDFPRVDLLGVYPNLQGLLLQA